MVWPLRSTVTGPRMTRASSWSTDNGPHVRSRSRTTVPPGPSLVWHATGAGGAADAAVARPASGPRPAATAIKDNHRTPEPRRSVYMFSPVRVRVQSTTPRARRQARRKLLAILGSRELECGNTSSGPDGPIVRDTSGSPVAVCPRGSFGETASHSGHESSLRMGAAEASGSQWALPRPSTDQGSMLASRTVSDQRRRAAASSCASRVGCASLHL